MTWQEAFGIVWEIGFPSRFSAKNNGCIDLRASRGEAARERPLVPGYSVEGGGFCLWGDIMCVYLSCSAEFQES